MADWCEFFVEYTTTSGKTKVIPFKKGASLLDHIEDEDLGGMSRDSLKEKLATVQDHEGLISADAGTYAKTESKTDTSINASEGSTNAPSPALTSPGRKPSTDATSVTKLNLDELD